MPARIGTVLWLLVAFDATLTTWVFVFPDTWFAFWHGAPRVDPTGFIYRCGGNWFAFFAIQLIAALRWKRAPHWVPVVAGCRLGDCLTDLTCVLTAERVSVFGWIGFPLAGVMNLAIGAWLLRSYARTLK